MKIALGIEYDGSGFYGWQIQAEGRTVQGCVEEALARICDHPVRVYCAGRTDTGVHSAGQVVHFETCARRDPGAWILGVNANLPGDVSIIWARSVEPDFHARYSAITRSYRYLILNRRARSGLMRSRITFEPRPLDEHLMRAAARYLEGKQDFSAFRAAGCQSKSPVRTIHSLEVRRCGSMVSIDVEANAFLQHMVRNIAGVLMEIGRCRAAPEWAGEVLLSRNRALGGVTAPPDGLYFLNVCYPARFALPECDDPVILISGA